MRYPILFLLVACEASPDEPRASSQRSRVARSGSEAPDTGGGNEAPSAEGNSSCRPAGTSCEWDGDCCAGFCAWPIDRYGPGECAARLGAGEPCEYSAQCERGGCLMGVCTSGCVPERIGWECHTRGLRCCEGVCHDMGYGYGECGPPAADGEWCWRGETCASGLCVDYVCRSSDAAPL